jgi:hypothetical protein
MQSSERLVRLGLNPRRGQDPHSLSARPTAGFGEQRRLPDTSLASNHQRASPLRCAIDEIVQYLELALAT